METNGGRLSSQAGVLQKALYAHPGRYPRRNKYLLFMENLRMGPRLKGESAEVTVGINLAGKIDPSLRFTPRTGHALERGRLIPISERPSCR